MTEAGYVDLTAMLKRMAGPSRTEATLQSEIHTFMLSAGLNLGDDDLITLEAPSGDGRRIDISVGNVCIEVKRQLGSGTRLNDAVDQLGGYVADQTSALGRRYVGVLTDGSEWQLYHLGTDGQLELTSTHDVKASDPDAEALATWLSGVMSTEEQIRPTAAAIRTRLGSDSSGHQLEQADLRSLYSANRDHPEVVIKRELWAKLLTTALGTQFDVDDHDLFVEHTLLVATAEIVAHAVVGFDVTNVEPAALIGGDLFSRGSGILGVVEHDFFDWPLDCGAQGERWVQALAKRLHQFDWASTRHDAMKTLYESVISQETRKRLGEYYTPDWLAEHMVDITVSDPVGTRVLDPSCGSGTFLFHAVRHYLEAAEQAGQSVRDQILGLVTHVAGVDVHPVAVTLARVTYLLAIGPDRLRADDRPSFHVPVYLGDSVQWGQERQDLFTADTFTVDIADADQPTLQGIAPEDLRFPRDLLDDADNFDRLVAELADAASNRAPNSPHPSVKQIARRYGLAGADLETVGETFRVMCRLHDEKRDRIWGYFVRNLARPTWLAKEENRVDVLIGNPPWLAYRFMAPGMREEFRRMCQQRQLWSGGSAATNDDLSHLFVVRAIEQYLRLEGRFSFVMPNGVLTRSQYEGFRTGHWPAAAGPLFVRFDDSWDLAQTMPPYYFPRTCAVIHGSRAHAGQAAPLPATVETWIGGIASDLTWEQASDVVARQPGEVAVYGDVEETSPWKDRFTEGATIVPRMLTTVEPDDQSTFMGTGARRRAVRSSRGVYEKAPWKNLPTLSGTVEVEYVYPLVLGETVLPFLQRDPLLTVLPMSRKGTLIEATSSPGLHSWWSRSSQLFDEHSNGTMSLLDQVDYRSKLTNQFPAPAHRVVVTHSGMHVTACRLDAEDAVVEHQLDWAAVRSEEEGLFLITILNSPLTTEAATPFMTSGKGGGRHIGKSLWNVPIPLYDADDDAHRALVDLGREAEEFVATVELPDAPHGNIRRMLREQLVEAGITERINALVRQVVRPADPGAA